MRAARHSAVIGLRIGHCDGMATLGILGHCGRATRKLDGRSFQAQCSFMYQRERKCLRLVALLQESTASSWACRLLSYFRRSQETLPKRGWDMLRENSCEVDAQNINLDTSPGSQASIFLWRVRTPRRDSSREFALDNLHRKLG